MLEDRVNKRRSMFGVSSRSETGYVAIGPSHTIRLVMNLLNGYVGDLDASLEDCERGESTAAVNKMRGAE